MHHNIRQKQVSPFFGRRGAEQGAAWSGILIVFFMATLHPFDLSGENLTVAWILFGIVILTTIVVIIWLLKKIDETTDELVSEIDDLEDTERSPQA